MMICDRCQGKDDVMPTAISVSTDVTDAKLKGTDLCKRCREQVTVIIREFLEPLAQPARVN